MILIQVMLLFTLLVGLVTFAVDYGQLRHAKTELQSTVESAALAGTAGLAVSPAEARVRAKAVAAQNTVNGAPLALLDSDLELGIWDTAARTFTPVSVANESTANAMRITGRLAASRNTQVRTPFLRTIGGQSSFDLRSASVACRSVRTEDIVVVQDLSQSFVDEVGYARQGDADLLESLNTSGGSSSFGLVAFTGTSKTIASLKKVSGNYSSLASAVNSLKIDGSGMPPTGSGTDIAAGIEQAQVVFDAYTSTSASRSMVIVSDGEPTTSSKGKHPTLSASQLLTLARQDADTAWGKGINVFVVFWNASNDATAAANLKSLVRGRGIFVNVTDPTKLSEAIRNVFSNTSLVK
ncbi:MAG: vWA domain-containing protein [Phycisphaerae bacterium]